MTKSRSCPCCHKTKDVWALLCRACWRGVPRDLKQEHAAAVAEARAFKHGHTLRLRNAVDACYTSVGIYHQQELGLP